MYAILLLCYAKDVKNTWRARIAKRIATDTQRKLSHMGIKNSAIESDAIANDVVQ